MFERVEIIRGPASSLYGDSAFFAVVNVITRSGESLGGGTVTLEAGTLGTRLARGSFGHRLASGLDFAVSGTYEHSDGVARLYYPAFDTPATNNGIAEGLDGEAVRQVYGHMAFKDLTFTGAYGARRRGVPTASNFTVFNEQVSPEETTDRHTLLDVDFSRSFSGTRVTLRGSFDRFTYDGIYPFAADVDGAPSIVGLDKAIGSRWTADAGLTRALPGRQTVRAGIEFIDNMHQDQTGEYLDPPTPVFDSNRSSTQQAAYLQDEIRPVSWLILNGGLRYDRYEDFHRVTPRTAVIVMPTSTESFKYLYGQAFRAPNAYELNTTFYGDAVRNLRPESIATHELVWERYTNDSLRTAVSAYWYKANRLITQSETSDPAALIGVTFVNQDEVRARGLEFEAQMRLKWRSQALVSYAVQKATDQGTGSELPNSPRHLVQGRFSIPGPIARSFLAVDAQHLSSRKLVGGDRVAAATTVNLTMTQPIGASWELFGSVRNLFDARYSDPASDQHIQLTIPQNGRTARIGLRWTVWTR
jgi:iron complex outermembrane receptor protein